MRIGAGVFLFLAASGATVHAYDDAVLQRGRAAATALNETLGTRMTRSLRDSGPEGAMSVCAWQARALADEVGQKDGVTVKRTSLKLRNPANAPDAYEKELLARLAARAREGDLPDESLDERRENGRTVYRYARPLVAGPLCITCHGRPADIPAEVRRMLETRYPEDAATGYGAGDFVGIVSVVIPER